MAAAYKLTQAGVAVDIYEASSSVGGFCRTFELWGYKVDLGPHRFFSSSPRVNQLWQKILVDDYVWVRRQTRIFYKQKYFEYPLRPLNTFFQLGVRESFGCLWSYLLGKRNKKTVLATNFEDWVVSKFGRRLFEIFFKSYSERLWGLPCKMIDADFAERKIRKMSLMDILKKFVTPQKTFVEYFAYPKQGTGATYEKFKNIITQSGGVFFLNEPVRQFDPNAVGIKLTTDLRQSDYDHVISTMPITNLVDALRAPPAILEQARELQFRNTILVYLLIEGDGHFKDNWVYVHTPDIDCGRVTNFRNWSPLMCQAGKNTVLCMEYWCNDEDSLWKMSDDELIQKAEQELRSSKIIERPSIHKGHISRLAKTYPVFKVGYRNSLEAVTQYLSGIQSLIVIGRNGSFKYNNQDHSLLMGLKAADQILSGHREVITVFDNTYEEDHPAQLQVQKEFDEI